METELQSSRLSGAAPSKTLRIFWGSLLVLLALNAFGGGLYALLGASGIPVEWLRGSPFHSYFIPGLFLFVVIGGGALTAAILVFTGHKKAFLWSVVICLIVFAWLIVQVAIIGLVSFMQLLTFLVVLLIALLSVVYKNRLLSGKR